MSRLIDATKYKMDLLKTYDDVTIEFDVLNRQPTVDAIIISEKTTNGDMIMTMFSNLRVEDNGGSIYLHYPDGGWIVFDRDWWNTTYTAERT